MGKIQDKNDIDAIALKRKLSKIFNEKYSNKDGTINYEKLKEAEKRLKVSAKRTHT